MVFVLYPLLLALKYFNLGGINIPENDLNLIFIILACVTLPLAGMTANAWPTRKSTGKRSKGFSKRYKLLTPLSLLVDRANQRTARNQPAGSRKARSGIHPQSSIPTPTVSLAQWATLPIFQQSPDAPTESLLDLVDNPILLIDNDGNILAVNHSAQNTLQLTEENIKFLKITDIIPRLFPDPDEETEPLQKFTFENNKKEVVGIARETQAITAKGKKLSVQLRMSKQEAHNQLVIVVEMIPLV
jgi:PAS domain-containing protein